MEQLLDTYIEAFRTAENDLRDIPATFRSKKWDARETERLAQRIGSLEKVRSHLQAARSCGRNLRQFEERVGEGFSKSIERLLVQNRELEKHLNAALCELAYAF